MTASAHSGSPGPGRLDHLHVVGQAAGQRAGAVVLEVLPDHGRVGDRGERGGQLRVPRLGHEQAVELAVQLDDRGQVLAVAGPAHRAHLPGQPGQLVQLGPGQPGHRLADRVRLEPEPDLEDLPQLGGAPRGHPGAAVRAQLDQPLGGQPGQRLADRGPAHRQLPGQVDLADPGAGRDPPGQDALPDDVSGLLSSLSHGAPWARGRRDADCMQYWRRPAWERKTRPANAVILTPDSQNPSVQPYVACNPCRWSKLPRGTGCRTSGRSCPPRPSSS